jgi:hypothetical protein
MRYPKATLLFLFVCFTYTAWSRTDSLWRQYSAVSNDGKRLSILFAIGDKYYAENNIWSRDSVFQIILTRQYMQPKNSNEKLAQIFKWYFSNDYALMNKNALDYASTLEEIGKHDNNNERLYDAYLLYCRIYAHRNNFGQAASYADKANYYANNLNRDDLKAESLLQLGNCQENLNNKIEAFRNYKDALYIAEKIGNDTLQYGAYGHLSDFFRRIKRYSEAEEYIQKQFGMLFNAFPADSQKLMLLYKNFANVLFNKNVKDQPEQLSEHVISYANRHNDRELKEAVFSMWRTYLLENNLFHELSELYTKKYPNEFEKIREESPAQYCRLNAFISEANGYPDSAAHYYAMTEGNIANNSQNDAFTANFFRRYGQFLLRQRDTIKAKEKFLQSLYFAKQARYYPYIIDATNYLEIISLTERKPQLAYEYEKQNRLYTDSVAITAKQDEVLLMEIDNKNKQAQLEEEKTKARTERRYYTEYVGIVLMISILFTILVLLGFLKVPKFTIKATGFVSFILLFEFIVMLTDARVETYTNHEPWKILLFKLLIICVLAPMHHWLEHKVIGYLYDHQLIDSSKMKLRSLVANIKKAQKEDEGKSHK